jgi:SAM-dependent methyltransferase
VTETLRSRLEATTHGVPIADDSRARRLDRPWYRYAESLLPPAESGTWLDLGCGQGEFLERAASMGLSGVGLDRSRDNARATLAAKRPCLLADLSQPLPFGDAAIAGASLIEVIEHVFDAERLVAELARVIEPGGWLVLSTPNVAHLTYRWRAITGHPPKQEGYHLRFFTKRRLASLLEAAGFDRMGSASFGKQALLTKLLRLRRGGNAKFRYRVPYAAESLLAQHFVWKLKRSERASHLDRARATIHETRPDGDAQESDEISRSPAPDASPRASTP